jgi:hypothetical protein
MANKKKFNIAQKLGEIIQLSLLERINNPRPISGLLFLYFTEKRRLGQGEDHGLLAGDSADIVVQTHNLNAGSLLDHCFQNRPCRFDQLSPYLLDQVPPFFARERFDQVLFRCRQDTLKTDHEKRVNQIGVNILRSPTHVFLLKAADPLANGCFDFSLGFYSQFQTVPFVPGRRPTRRQCQAKRTELSTDNDIL